MIANSSLVEWIVSLFVTLQPHETSCLIHSASSFFFILSAYFVVLPLRDEGAISLGLENLPSLFVGSLILTLVAAPVSSLVFALPNLSKQKALVFIHRFFSLSLVTFFILWLSSTSVSSHSEVKELIPMNVTTKLELKFTVNQTAPVDSISIKSYGLYYFVVRTGFFLWVALLNLITISSTWARITDVMDNESGLRLFGFIGAGATLGQLCGSLFATAMAWFGPYLLVVAALLLEFAAQTSKGIKKEIPNHVEELSPLRKADTSHHCETNEENVTSPNASSPRTSTTMGKPQFWAIFDGPRLILSSSYLMKVALFLWLSAIVSSFFYFQKITVVASSVASPVDRRRTFAQINSLIAFFILGGQFTVTGRILALVGVTTAICSTPSVGFINLIALAVWPSWITVAISETLRKVVTYVVTRPAREILFTVVSQDEKYKAKVCIDVIVQRLGDATSAAIYKLFFTTLNGNTSAISLYALPVCFLWIVVAFYLGRHYAEISMSKRLSKTQN